MSMIEQYMKRVKHATSSKSKEVNLTLIDAQVLTSEISGLLASENKNLNTIVELQETVINLKNANNTNNTNNITPDNIKMDGGGF